MGRTMARNQQRIREYMAVETQALIHEANRSRLWDHNTNRGTEAEHAILRWIRRRVEPNFTVSSGEIIDSYDTDSDTKSRQQDGILHANTLDANRFLLPSGMRLVPIESVAAVIEVKLNLDKAEFNRADQAAAETGKLRLSLSMHNVPRWKSHGLPASELGKQFSRPLTFAVFGFGGTSNVVTMAEWVKDARAISLACCLGAGCVQRTHLDVSRVAAQDESLSMFAESIRDAINAYERRTEGICPDYTSYDTVRWKPYWDSTGYECPPDMSPAQLKAWNLLGK